jgi:hypothetical protein
MWLILKALSTHMNKQFAVVSFALFSVMFLSVSAFLPLLDSPLLAKSISPHVPPKRKEMRGDSPTPTYDPLAQPPLPPDPSEYEFGRYLYWLHCMPCHGDHGQGLTDEFRRVWVEDHQNCWGRGCHSGKYAEDSFYVPTIVPALVTSAQLAQFQTQQDLLDYLRSTHPPQDPGFLEEDEYHALAFFVLTLNGRLTEKPTPQPTVTPTPSLPPPSHADPLQGYVPIVFIASILFISTFVIVLKKRTEVRAPGKNQGFSSHPDSSTAMKISVAEMMPMSAPLSSATGK